MVRIAQELKDQGNKFLTDKEREKIAEDKRFAEFDAQMEQYRLEREEMLRRREEENARAARRD